MDGITRAILGDRATAERVTESGNLLPCPWCRKHAVFIGVHDDEGNYHGRRGCEYEKEPWSGLSYALHHEGWGDCILCTDGENQTMGGVLFDTAKEAAMEWNARAPILTPEQIKRLEDENRETDL